MAWSFATTVPVEITGRASTRTICSSVSMPTTCAMPRTRGPCHADSRIRRSCCRLFSMASNGRWQSLRTPTFAKCAIALVMANRAHRWRANLAFTETPRRRPSPGEPGGIYDADLHRKSVGTWKTRLRLHRQRLQPADDGSGARGLLRHGRRAAADRVPDHGERGFARRTGRPRIPHRRAGRHLRARLEPGTGRHLHDRVPRMPGDAGGPGMYGLATGGDVGAGSGAGGV